MRHKERGMAHETCLDGGISGLIRERDAVDSAADNARVDSSAPGALLSITWLYIILDFHTDGRTRRAAYQRDEVDFGIICRLIGVVFDISVPHLFPVCSLASCSLHPRPHAFCCVLFVFVVRCCPRIKATAYQSGSSKQASVALFTNWKQ